MKATVQGLPGEAGIELANWNWRSVRQFVLERFGISLSRRSCLNYLHRLGFVLKQPKKRLVNLPGYSPDFNADEAIWGWAREEATGNLCLGTKSLVQERVGNFLHGLSCRKEEVKRRCRTVLQSRAERFLRESLPGPRCTANAHPTLALV